MLQLLLIGALGANAWATSGPWVVGTGTLDTYVGIEAHRLERLHIQGPGGEGAEFIDVGEGLSTFGIKGIGTLGLASRVDLEIEVPWYRVIANRPDAELCGALGLNACKTTASVGVLAFEGKVLVLDELFGAPLSLAVLPELRVGTFTHPDRERITNIGEGTTDLGLVVSGGRTGGLGAGYWSAFVDVGYRVRLPNTRSYPGTSRAPHDEGHTTVEALFSPARRYGLGPTLSGLYRPGGLDFTELDLTDPDRLAALRVANLRVGLTAVVRDERGMSASVSLVRTVAVMNNPLVTLVSGGVSWNGKLRRPEEP